MIVNIYAVRDKAVNAFMMPLFFHSDEQAQRWFTDHSLSADGEISKHPEDYALFWIGSWNDVEGKVTDGETKRLCEAVEMIERSRMREKRQLELVEKGVANA